MIWFSYEYVVNCPCHSYSAIIIIHCIITITITISITSTHHQWSYATHRTDSTIHSHTISDALLYTTITGTYVLMKHQYNYLLHTINNPYYYHVLYCHHLHYIQWLAVCSVNQIIANIAIICYTTYTIITATIITYTTTGRYTIDCVPSSALLLSSLMYYNYLWYHYPYSDHFYYYKSRRFPSMISSISIKLMQLFYCCMFGYLCSMCRSTNCSNGQFLCTGVTTMLNFFTTSNGFRSTLPVVSNLTAMNVWDGVCMCFIYASLLEFVCVNYMGRKRPQHNVVYRPGENPVTQVSLFLIHLYIYIYIYLFIMH